MRFVTVPGKGGIFWQFYFIITIIIVTIIIRVFDYQHAFTMRKSFLYANFTIRDRQYIISGFKDQIWSLKYPS